MGLCLGRRSALVIPAAMGHLCSANVLTGTADPSEARKKEKEKTKEEKKNLEAQRRQTNNLSFKWKPR